MAARNLSERADPHGDRNEECADRNQSDDVLNQIDHGNLLKSVYVSILFLFCFKSTTIRTRLPECQLWLISKLWI